MIDRRIEQICQNDCCLRLWKAPGTRWHLPGGDCRRESASQAGSLSGERAKKHIRQPLANSETIWCPIRALDDWPSVLAFSQAQRSAQ
jgi:hypothetical protein